MTSQPIGLSHDLAPRQVMRAIVGQHDIAIWRSARGVINAWENRCPHRGMRLSHGFVRGESLACAYHGWHYDTTGFCHYIPAHPELTPPRTVQPGIFSVVEEAGLIWVNPVDEARAVALPKDTTPIRSLTFDCDLPSAVEALSATPHDANGHTRNSMTVISDSPKVVALTAGNHDDGLIIAFQQPGDSRLVAHVLVRQAVTTAERIALSRWLEAVRRRAEKTGTAS